REGRDVLDLVAQHTPGVPVPRVGADVEVERIVAQHGRHRAVEDLRLVALAALAPREEVAGEDEREDVAVEVVDDLAEQHVEAPVGIRGRVELERVAEVLRDDAVDRVVVLLAELDIERVDAPGQRRVDVLEDDGDRKSTRLNSSHVKISSAVFCVKKKMQ